MKKKLFFLFFLTFLFILTAIPIFAEIIPMSYPYVNSANIPDAISSGSWIVLTDNSGVHLYGCNASSAKFTYNGTDIVLSVNNYSKLYKYTYSDSVFNLVSETNFSFRTTITGTSINQAGVDVVNTDGTVFFPPAPLLETILALLEKEVPAILTGVTGDLRTLALFGVGLIALLVVLSLFGRALLPFLRI